MATQQQSQSNIYRPKQLLLIGLGGVGGRVVNRIMEKVPDSHKSYVQAVSIDTDIGEIQKLGNIPVENHIVLGDNTTIGGFMKKNPDTKDWMVKGDALDLIKSLNTKNGAKQIRMISRIALRATNDQGNLGKKIEQAINKVNAVDGKMQNSGLKVIVICSIAGGTGAGTVLQVPMYLEDAIRNTYDQSSVEFECAMLMPNTFSTTLSRENYINAKVNGYAVIRELMSLNKGKMRRYEYFDAHEVDTTDKRIAPYGRIMLFDSTNGKGEAITGAVDTTHVPLMADALVEYLFGPASIRITSALDNTLKKVYDTDGAGIFGAVGRGSLVYPKRLYQQYSVAKWIDSSISNTWLYADEKAEKAFNDEQREARKNGKASLDKKNKYAHYTDAVYGSDSGFFKNIQNQLMDVGTGEDSGEEVEIAGNESLAEKYWSIVCDELEDTLIYKNEGLAIASDGVTLDKDFTYRKRRGLAAAKDGFRNYYIALDSLPSKVNSFAREFMCPTEAKEPNFYSEDRKETHINHFIREKNLHPVALRCFLYELYWLMQENVSDMEIESPDQMSDSFWDAMLEKKKNRDIEVSDYRNKLLNDTKIVLKSNLAKAMLIYLEEMIEEVEDLFNSVKKVKAFFTNDAKNSLEGIDKLSNSPDTVVAGSTLSAVNCWNTLEGVIHGGEEGSSEVIDDDLSKKLNEMIYKGYFKHMDSRLGVSGKKQKYNFRIPTDYNVILVKELQNYYYDKVSITYNRLFPENVVDAVRYDCGVKNYWNIINDNAVVKIPMEDFFCEDPYDEDLYTTAKNKKLSAFDLVDTLNNLLSLALGKSEPRCGRVNEGGYTNRYMIMNRSILSEESDQSDLESGGVSKITYDETRIIPGVRTDSIQGQGVNACFDGKSENIITFATVYAALEPSDFHGFLAPTSDVDDPQDAMNYYKEYRKYMNEVAANPKMITPHLDRNWHLGGKLLDITEEYTASSWRYAAKAFVYGFVYDTIRIDSDGTVTFGEYGNKNFFGIAPNGEREEEFITPEQKADVSSLKLSSSAKIDLNNYILYNIFEKLISYYELSTAIIDDAEMRITEEVQSGRKEFTKKTLEDENVANINYNCILDIIDGYYKGSSNARYDQKDYVVETSTYMFEVLITAIFNQIKDGSQSMAKIRDVSKKTIQILYRKAICDDIVKDRVVTVDAGEDLGDELDLLLESLDSEESDSQKNPFCKRGRFSEERALALIDLLLRKSEM